MKIAIFGATGLTGSELLKQALQSGHEVTAFVRTPEKIMEKHENLRVFQGDVLDFPAVEQAVEGQDAVFCVLGAGRNGSVRSRGTENIVQAMEKTGVRRLIVQSTLGAGDSKANLNFWWKYIMFGLLLRQAYADHERQEEIVVRSGLEWTLVRPAALVKGALTGKYHHGDLRSNKTLTLKISVPDVADFLLKQLTDPIYLRKTTGISY
jgi:putative NADH-flavin reductase